VVAEGQMLQTMLGANRWAIVQCDFEKDNLHHDHEAGLDEKGAAVVCTEPVKHSINSCQLMYQVSSLVSYSYFSIEATSMMRGMSREKPSLFFVR
jgi:hypothetical protein